jgi:hypothetical protein
LKTGYLGDNCTPSFIVAPFTGEPKSRSNSNVHQKKIGKRNVVCTCTWLRSRKKNTDSLEKEETPFISDKC